MNFTKSPGAFRVRALFLSSSAIQQYSFETEEMDLMMSNQRASLRILSSCFAALALAACASLSPGPYGAYGYMAADAVGDGEFIGEYASRSDCEVAAEAWMSTQVAGNPVHAACYPVDRN